MTRKDWPQKDAEGANGEAAQNWLTFIPILIFYIRPNMRLGVNRMEWKDAPVWLRVLWVIAVANFLAFWLVAFLSGGDALNGKEEGGRYFIASHGHYTEVTRNFFLYSRVHAMSAMILIALSMVVALWVNWRKNLR